MCLRVHSSPLQMHFFPGIVQGRSLQAGSRIQHRGQLRSGQRSKAASRLPEANLQLLQDTEADHSRQFIPIIIIF